MAERKKTVKSMLPMNNGVSEQNRKAVIECLHQELADHYVLVTKTRFYHWNVEGPEFHDLHELLDEQYAIIAEQIDQIAEQALQLGGQAPGTLAWFLGHARLKEDNDENIPDTRRMIQNLLDDHEAIMTNLHGEIGTVEEENDDKVTSNFLQEISAQHHKMAWMLRMILQNSSLEGK
jgi:starvation-inducible DNA-binding protein